MNDKKKKVNVKKKIIKKEAERLLAHSRRPLLCFQSNWDTNFRRLKKQPLSLSHSLRTFRMCNKRTQMNSDGVLFPSTPGAGRPSPDAVAWGAGEERVRHAARPQASASSTGRAVCSFNYHYLHFLHRPEREEKVKYIPVVKEVHE